jgi:1,2-phenylacetyl-CoA epoxidase PaaB subunit
MKEYTWHVWKVCQGKSDMHVGRVQASDYESALERAKRIYGLSCDYVEQGNEVR